MCSRKVDRSTIILNNSTDSILVCADFPIIRTKIENHPKQFFSIKTQNSSLLGHLNYCVTQSDDHVTINQIEHALKMANKYFSRVLFLKSDIPFGTNCAIKDEIVNVQPCTLDEIELLTYCYRKYASNCSSTNHVLMCRCLDVSCSRVCLGYFLTCSCTLRLALLHETICCMHAHANIPLILLKSLK